MQETINLKQFPLLVTVIAQITVIFISALLTIYVKNKFLTKTQYRLAKTNNIWDDAVISALISPSTAFIWLLFTDYSLKLIAQAISNPVILVDVSIYLRSIGIIIIFTFFIIKVISRLEKNYFKKFDQDTTLDSASSYLLGKILRAIAITIAIITIFQSCGYSLTALLTFGGAGSLVVGFAAKEMISNFFGGLMVHLDRPFKVGDLIKTESNHLEGVIEKIGWRSTRIRNLEKRPVYVPNSIWVTAPVENITRMSNRRVREIFGIRYKDADKLEVIMNDIEQELYNHDEIDKRQTILVRLNDFGASSLNIMVYFFTTTTNFKDFLTVKQNIYLKIIRILHKYEADFAFPTTTIDLPNYNQGNDHLLST